MKKNSKELTSLIIATILISSIFLTSFLDFIMNGETGGWISTLCYIAAGILVIIGWFQYFHKQEKTND